MDTKNNNFSNYQFNQQQNIQHPWPRHAFSEIDSVTDASEFTNIPKFQQQQSQSQFPRKFQSPVPQEPILPSQLNQIQNQNLQLNNNQYQPPQPSIMTPMPQNQTSMVFNLPTFKSQYPNLQQEQYTPQNPINQIDPFETNQLPTPMRNITNTNTQRNNQSLLNLKDLKSQRQSKLQIPQELLEFDQNYFPPYTIFLLSDEDKNLSNFRERIEKEKNRVDQDFQNMKLEFNNLFDDLKVNVLQGIDDHFKALIANYKRFKEQVIEYKNVKLEVPQVPVQPPSKYDINNASNTQLIRELEEMRHKNQISKVYQYIQEIQKDSLQKIICCSQELMQQMSQSSHLYNSEAACRCLKDIKNIFAQNLQLKFEPMSQFVKQIQTEPFLDNKSISNNFGQQTQIFNQAPQNIYSDISYHQPIDETPQKEKQDYKQNIQRMFSRPQEAEQQFLNQLQNQPSPFKNKPETNSVNIGTQNLITNKHVSSNQLQLSLFKTLETGHTDILLCFAVINDEIVATGCKDGTIGLFKFQTNERIGVLQGHKGSICCLSVIAQGSRRILASAGDVGDNSIIIWDVVSQKMIHQLHGHQAAVVSLISLDDNQTLISASYDKDIIIWNYASGNMINKLSTHQNSISCLTLSKDKQRFISCDLDNIMNIWKINYNNQKFQLCQLERSIQNTSLICSLNTVRFDNDQLLIGGKDGKIKIFNIKSGEQEREYSCGLGPIVELLVIEGQQSSVVLSCSNKQRNLIVTDLKEGDNAMIDVQDKLHIDFGCGISPKLQFLGSKYLFMISQKQDKKEITIWNILY